MYNACRWFCVAPGLLSALWGTPRVSLVINYAHAFTLDYALRPLKIL